MTGTPPRDADTDAELAAWARARIASDMETLISKGMAVGIFKEGGQVRPALDIESGALILADIESRCTYALAPAEGIIGQDAAGNILDL